MLCVCNAYACAQVYICVFVCVCVFVCEYALYTSVQRPYVLICSLHSRGMKRLLFFGGSRIVNLYLLYHILTVTPLTQVRCGVWGKVCSLCQKRPIRQTPWVTHNA